MNEPRQHPEVMPLARFIVRRGLPVTLAFAAIGAVAMPTLAADQVPNFDWTEDGSVWLTVGGIAVGLLVLQVGLLSGAPLLRRGRPIRRRSAWVSVAVGGLVMAGLLAGIFAAVGETFLQDQFRDVSPYVWTILGWLWVAWGVGLWLADSRAESRFRLIHRLLMAGTVLELLITIPMDAVVRRRANCYCGSGTFFALMFGLTGAVVAFGPVVVLMMARRLLVPPDKGRCEQCGYDLRGLPEPRCPECGKGFDPGLMRGA
jgi:hypothetical protein